MDPYKAMKIGSFSPQELIHDLMMTDPHHPVFDALEEYHRCLIRALSALKRCEPKKLLDRMRLAQARMEELKPPPDTPMGTSIDHTLSHPPLVVMVSCSDLLQSLLELLDRAHPPEKMLDPCFDPLTTPTTAAGCRLFKLAATRNLRKAGHSPAEIAELIEGTTSPADVERTRSRIYRKD